MSDRVKAYKIVIVGDGAVGKTTLRKKYFGDNFETEYAMTLGADFAIKNEQVGNRYYMLQIWDLGGQPQFKDIRSAYYMNSSGLIMVFDVTKIQTFKNLPLWIDEFTSNYKSDAKNVPLILVGNKIDLRYRYQPGSVESQSVGSEIVSTMEGMEYAKVLSEWSNHDVPYVETSALVGLNIQVPFKSVILNLDKAT